MANRALFQDRLQHALAQAGRTGQPVAVLLADLDGFKQVNDSLGHDVGDQLLSSIAHRLAATTRPGDTIARLGGDEFAVVLESTDERGAQIAAARLVSESMVPVSLVGRELAVGTSVGIAVATEPGMRSEELVRQADVAMYAAKQAGGGRVDVFRPELARHAGELLGLEHELRSGLSRGEFVLHYQPEVALADGGVVGVEALIRWQSPTRGLVGPSAFIPAAESTTAILALGQFVIDEACEQTARWEREHELPERFATWVNLSAKQLAAGGVRATIEAALRRAGLPAHRLGVELTETALVAEGTSTDTAHRELEDLHALGVRIAIDDFGTGFSSLAHLRRFPVDALKLDQCFVAGIDQHSKDAAIAANVINLAHALGLFVVAEGVETAEQLEQLNILGCDVGQGFLFARPAAAEAIGELLTASGDPAEVAVSARG
ncbi:MAG: EAL domain-containing protein [Actinomycetota bacterium]|nr:EAL domain-containing protein [Actinomycetota bacterium]